MPITVPTPAPNNVFSTQSAECVGVAVPFIYGDSGNVAANGVDTLGTALPVAYPNAYKWYNAGQVFAGSAAGWYLVQFSSTTVGTIFNNTYVAGTQPSIPPQNALVPIVAAGPGAYTAATGATVGPSFSINGSMVGPSGGVLNLTMMVAVNNSAGAKTPLLSINAVTLLSSALTTTTGNVYQQTVFCRAQPVNNVANAFQNPQVAFGATAGALGAQTPAYSATTGLERGALGVAPTFSVSLNVAVATDFIVLEGVFAEAYYNA